MISGRRGTGSLDSQAVPERLGNSACMPKGRDIILTNVGSTTPNSVKQEQLP
ncbi:MAG: hypothetical protein KA791_15895 [Flavobacteriales bacterium]|nr:hypothetical protein [Flavobacteriales bacterium]